MKKYVLLGLVGMLGYVSSCWGESLTVGYVDAPPLMMETEEENHPTGIAVEYLLLILQDVGITDIRFKKLPVSRLLEYLEEGKIDAAAMLMDNPKRRMIFALPERPYFSEQQYLAVLTDHPLRNITRTEDLLSLQIGVFQGGFLAPTLQDSRLRLEPLSGGEVVLRNLKKLLAGRLDAVYCPGQTELEYWIKTLQISSQVRLVLLPDEPIEVYPMFSKQSATRHLSQFNASAERIQRQMPPGTFKTEYFQKLFRE